MEEFDLAPGNEEFKSVHCIGRDMSRTSLLLFALWLSIFWHRWSIRKTAFLNAQLHNNPKATNRKLGKRIDMDMDRLWSCRSYRHFKKLSGTVELSKATNSRPWPERSEKSWASFSWRNISICHVQQICGDSAYLWHPLTFTWHQDWLLWYYQWEGSLDRSKTLKLRIQDAESTCCQPSLKSFQFERG